MDKNSLLNKASKQFRKLVQKDIRSKNLIKSGDLVKSIEAKFTSKGGEIFISIGAIFYYTYLDDGTKNIKSFDITEDVLDSQEFADIMEDLIVDIVEVRLDKKIAQLGKKNITIK